METWIAIVKDIGFPAAVAFYVLHRLDRRLEGIDRKLWSLLEWHRKYSPIPQQPPRDKRGERG